MSAPLLATIDVPPVAAALAFVCKPCCRPQAEDQAVPIGPCACQETIVEWVTGGEPIEPGTRVQIRAGESDGWAPDGWRWETEMDGSFDHLALKDDPRVKAWLHPGEVVGTATVAECAPVFAPSSDAEKHRYLPAAIVSADHWIDYWPEGSTEPSDISDQLLDQDWSPTRKCPECWLTPGVLHTAKRYGVVERLPCPRCDGPGTVGRYAYKLATR